MNFYDFPWFALNQARTGPADYREIPGGPVGRWAGGPVGRWAGGPVGRWAGGPVGWWTRWPVANQNIMIYYFFWPLMLSIIIKTGLFIKVCNGQMSQTKNCKN